MRWRDTGTILAFRTDTAAIERHCAAADVYCITRFEVHMSGRRSHARFAMLRSPEGVLRVVRDVVIQSTTNEHIVAISREPAVLGTSVSVQLSAHHDSAVPARVLESHPIVVDGHVRHRLRLHHGLAAASPEGQSNG